MYWTLNFPRVLHHDPNLRPRHIQQSCSPPHFYYFNLCRCCIEGMLTYTPDWQGWIIRVLQLLESHYVFSNCTSLYLYTELIMQYLIVLPCMAEEHMLSHVYVSYVWSFMRTFWIVWVWGLIVTQRHCPETVTCWHVALVKACTGALLPKWSIGMFLLIGELTNYHPQAWKSRNNEQERISIHITVRN